MKELLKYLTREELQELGKKYLSEYKNVFASNVLVAKLSKHIIKEEDVEWIKQAAAERGMKNPIEVEAELAEVLTAKVDTTYLDEDTGRPLTSAELEQKARTKGEQLLRELTAQARAAANKTVIALVNPANQEDINLQKTCESFITGNAYFTISVVVPFGVYVEIPKAIAQVIKEATCPQVIELNDYQRSKIQGKPIAVINNIRKYNIQVWTKDQFANMQGKIPD